MDASEYVQARTSWPSNLSRVPAAAAQIAITAS